MKSRTRMEINLDEKLAFVELQNDKFEAKYSETKTTPTT